MTCSYSVHKWCWNWVHGCEPDQHVELVSLRWRFFFYTLCIDIVVAFLAQDINYSGDSYWKGLATHLSNLCYGMLQEGQFILHVRWISQVENIVNTEGCNYPFFNSYSPAHPPHHPLWQGLEPSWRKPFSSQFLPTVWLGMEYLHHTVKRKEKKRKC